MQKCHNIRQYIPSIGQSVQAVNTVLRVYGMFPIQWFYRSMALCVGQQCTHWITGKEGVLKDEQVLGGFWTGESIIFGEQKLKSSV